MNFQMRVTHKTEQRDRLFVRLEGEAGYASLSLPLEDANEIHDEWTLESSPKKTSEIEVLNLQAKRRIILED